MRTRSAHCCSLFSLEYLRVYVCFSEDLVRSRRLARAVPGLDDRKADRTPISSMIRLRGVSLSWLLSLVSFSLSRWGLEDGMEVSKENKESKSIGPSSP